MKLIALVSIAFAGLIAGNANAATKAHHAVSSYDSDYSTSRRSSGDETNMVGFQFGPQVATGSISVDTGTTPDTDSRTRLNTGVYFEHVLSTNFVLRPELNFSERGYSIAQSGGTTDYSANYFELPVMIKGQLPLQGFAPYVMTGPLLGVLIGKGVNFNAADGTQTSGNLNNQVNSFEFGWNFGIGTSVDITRGWKMDGGLRYSLGLTNVASTTGGLSTKLSAFQILVGASTAI